MLDIPKKKIWERSVVRFAGVGVLNTAVDIAVYNLLLILGLHVLVAGAIGFMAGFTNGYFFNSRYVFKQASHDRYVKYLLVSLGGLIITEIILYLFHERSQIGENPAKLIAVPIVFTWNYGLSKFWAFK